MTESSLPVEPPQSVNEAAAPGDPVAFVETGVEAAPPTPGPPPAPSVRASDAEREAVVRQLTVACGDGRLTLEELGSRVGLAYTAVSRGDLVPLVSDLPETVEATPLANPLDTRPDARSKVKKKGKWVVAIMGSATRSGHWRLSSHANVVTVMGEAELDLRQALIDAPEIELNLYLCMGEQRVIVPEGVEVEVTGIVVMGERKVDVAPVRPRPGVPRLHIKVRGLMGEVHIRTG